jgi:hypothetical protein
MNSADGKVKIGKHFQPTMLKCNDITGGCHDFVRRITQDHNEMLEIKCHDILFPAFSAEKNIN